MAYLKDIIASTPDGILTAKVESIGAPEPNKNGKLLRKIGFVFTSTSQRMTEGVFEFNFKAPRGSLVGLKVGDTVEMKLEDGWPIYRILTATSEETAAPSQTNYGQVAGERAATAYVKKDDEKSIAISLQGLVQSYVAGPAKFSDDGMEIILNEALSFAVRAREAILKKARDIANQDNNSLPF